MGVYVCVAGGRQAALKVPIRTAEDREAHAEAVEALKKLVPAK